MTADTSHRKLRYAMVGGGRDAFIGAVHRKAIALDGQAELVAGALSSSAEKARASGRDLFLADERNHGDWQSLLDDELKRPPDERIDFVSIVTPNHVHFPVAQAFVEAGFHVVCDKPLVHTREQADALVARGRAQGHGVRRHLQLHRLPDGARGARDGALRPARRDPQGGRRIQPGLARDAARKRRQQAGRLAQRPGAKRRGRRHRRHRLACREPGRHGDRPRDRKPLRRPERAGAGPRARRRRQPAAALPRAARAAC